jgi:hypothetical protein
MGGQWRAGELLAACARQSSVSGRHEHRRAPLLRGVRRCGSQCVQPRRCKRFALAEPWSKRRWHLGRALACVGWLRSWLEAHARRPRLLRGGALAGGRFGRSWRSEMALLFAGGVAFGGCGRGGLRGAKPALVRKARSAMRAADCAETGSTRVLLVGFALAASGASRGQPRRCPAAGHRSRLGHRRPRIAHVGRSARTAACLRGRTAAPTCAGCRAVCRRSRHHAAATARAGRQASRWPVYELAWLPVESATTTPRSSTGSMRSLDKRVV